MTYPEKQPQLSHYFKNNVLPKFDRAYVIDVSHSKRFPRMLHMHKQQLELFYAHTGNGQYIVDGQQYEIAQGDFVICNAGVLHGEDPFSTRQLLSYCCAMSNVQIEGLPMNALTMPGDDPIIHTGALSEKLGNLMTMIHQLSPDARMTETCTCMAISVLLLVHQIVLRRNLHREPRQPKPTDALVVRIKQHLDTHYSEPITLEAIGHALHTNPYYLSHVFKNETGYSPIQYVMHRRMGEAQGLLMNTLLPVADIAEQIGYSGHCHFNAMFLKYVGISPGRYRRSLSDEEQTASAEE